MGVGSGRTAQAVRMHTGGRWHAIGDSSSLAARGKTPAAFDRRGILADCVARRSNMPDILPPRALSAGCRGENCQETRGRSLIPRSPDPPGHGSCVRKCRAQVWSTSTENCMTCADRWPVNISPTATTTTQRASEKHGRPVVVVLSTEEYEELEAIKLSRLRSEVDEGLDALSREDFIELDRNELRKAADEIKSAGRARSR